MKEFFEFIVSSQLIDVPCKGKNFSWFSCDGNSMSKIDRFLLLDKLIQRWGVVEKYIGERDILNHYPIWLKID